MTNQQGAPEALPDPSPDKLRAIARTARNSSGSASDDCGPLAYVLHGWRAAAIAFRAQQATLVEAQQLTTHVQNPAEIEHVASDVSKTEPEPNMAQQQECGNTPYDEGPFALAQPVAQRGAADGFFLLLPQRPKPEAPAGTAGLDWDAYSGAQMLAFGRDCSDAAIAALRAQQPAPATQKLTEQICISDTNQSAACAVGNVGTTSDAQTTHSTHDAPATQQVGEVPSGYVIDLIGKLVQAESNKTRAHQEYMGKAMPDDVYARFQRLRDETIPALRTQLLDALAAAPQPSPTPQADSQPAPEYVGNGMFHGETIQKAAEHWANWCDRRCMTGLSEFLRVVAARTPAEATPSRMAAQQGAAYAELPESLMLEVDRWFADNTGLGGCSGKDVRELAQLFYEVAHEGGRESVDDALAIVESFGPGISGLNDTYARQVLLAEEVKRLRASHGQASSQAGEDPALVCDYCGALTPDPWHSSGMLHGKMSKHIHSCDACAARAPADSVTAPAGGAAILKEILAAACCEDSETYLTNDQYRKLYDLQRRIESMPTQPTHAADSVPEDAARYRWLFGARTDAQTMSVSETVFKPLPQDEVLSHLQGFYMSKAVVDALVDAARKQGSE